ALHSTTAAHHPPTRRSSDLDGAKHVQEIAVSPDGGTVAIVDAGRATLWDLATNQPGPSFAIPNATRPDLVFFDGNRLAVLREDSDRKSTRLNSSHDQISYAV